MSDEADRVMSDTATSRRVLLLGVGTAAAAMLTGCATYGDTGGGNRGTGSLGPDDAGTVPDDSATGQNDGQALAQTSDVPVGGGFINDHKNIVITQPKAGTFKAFTAVCTHQGCIVAEVKDGKITCPCHGSQFTVTDGKVVSGPATRALREIAITVQGSAIQLA
jgi:Rieske Fe-S protein